jgi:hypothetical protein
MNPPAKTGNKFAAILQARHGPAVEEPEPAPSVASAGPKPTPPRPRPVAPAALETSQRAGRIPGKGKSSDPSYRQVTAYIPQALHNNATIALRLANQTKIDAEKEDFSELLTRLLAAWYERQTYYRPGQ